MCRCVTHQEADGEREEQSTSHSRRWRSRRMCTASGRRSCCSCCSCSCGATILQRCNFLLSALASRGWRRCWQEVLAGGAGRRCWPQFIQAASEMLKRRTQAGVPASGRRWTEAAALSVVVDLLSPGNLFSLKTSKCKRRVSVSVLVTGKKIHPEILPLTFTWTPVFSLLTLFWIIIKVWQCGKILWKFYYRTL